MSVNAFDLRPGQRSWAALFRRVVNFALADGKALSGRSRHQAATVTPIAWDGDLGRACSAHWLGMTLQAKEITRAHWSWSVYDSETQSVVMDSRMTYMRATTGKKARQAAEAAAKQFLADHEDAE